MKKNISIFVNQIGYVTNGTKSAYAKASLENDGSFSIKNAKTKEAVFTGKLTAAPEDPLTGEPILSADFSSFCTDGEYILSIGDEESFSFKIGSKLYGNLFFSVLDYFRLSRCGQEIEGGKWSHTACHTGLAEIYGTDEKKEADGGWHDAGDYGRYIVPGAKAVMDLLGTYDFCKDKFEKFDILAEVRFELEWMLKLQREDGGVYHKISCYHFCAFINPQDEKDKLVIAPVSTAATADFAGCLAHSSKYYMESDPSFAQKLVDAALRAQAYLDCHDDELYKNPQEITTGGYGDWNVKDERYFALCALYEVTGNKEFLFKAFDVKKAALALPEDPSIPWKKNWMEAFSWGCVASYGTEILLKNYDKVAADAGQETADEIKQILIKRADFVMKTCSASSFNVATRFIQWGCNGGVCDEAHFLMIAWQLTGKQDYYNAALHQIDYLLGCNPIGICYVTGNGTYRTENPHHRPSGVVGKAMPGMLVGGPSAGLQDAVAKAQLEGKPPLSCYIDKQGSYSTNEIAIYWNSSFAMLIASLGLV